jgi:hypothetical protein
MCEAETNCLTDGTIVTLGLNISCVNTLGPVSYVANQDGVDSALKLKINMIEFVHNSAPIVFCPSVIGEYELSLPNVFADVEQIELEVLK